MSDKTRRELERLVSGGDADAVLLLEHAHRREGYANATLLPDLLRTHPLAPEDGWVSYGIYTRDARGLPINFEEWRENYENALERQILLTTFSNGTGLSTVWEGLTTSMFNTAVLHGETTEVARHETVEEARDYHASYAGAMETAVRDDQIRRRLAAPRALQHKRRRR